MGRKAGRAKRPPDHRTKRKQAWKGLYTALERALHPFPRWWQKLDWATGTGSVNQIKTASRQAQKPPGLRNAGPLPLWERRTVRHSELGLAAQHSSSGLRLHSSKQHDHNCRHRRKKVLQHDMRPDEALPSTAETTRGHWTPLSHAARAVCSTHNHSNNKQRHLQDDQDSNMLQLLTHAMVLMLCKL